MGTEKNKKEGWKKRIRNFSGKTFSYFARWFGLLMIFGVLIFSVYVWNRYVFNAEWSEEKKKAYIGEQAVFSFDRTLYQKALDFVNSRAEKLKSQENFSGRDIFFPEGF